MKRKFTLKFQTEFGFKMFLTDDSGSNSRIYFSLRSKSKKMLHCF